MAYDANGLRAIAPGGNLNAADTVSMIYSYVTNDTAATVEANGYFDTSPLNLGDTVIASMDIDGTPAMKTYQVSVGTGDATSNDVTLSPAANLTFTQAYTMHASLVPLTDGTYWLGTAAIAGTIAKIYTVLSGTVATNDGVCTFRIGTTNITNGVVTVATSGSAAGVKDSATPSAANVVAAGDALSVVVSNTPGSSRTLEVDILINP